MQQSVRAGPAGTALQSACALATPGKLANDIATTIRVQCVMPPPSAKIRIEPSTQRLAVPDRSPPSRDAVGNPVMSVFDAPSDPPVVFPPIHRCIYCPNDGSDGLGDEHIIPFALNGTQILPQASCHECERITSYLDGFIARSVFWHVRTSAGMQSRSGLPDEFPVILKFEDAGDPPLEQNPSSAPRDSARES